MKLVLVIAPLLALSACASTQVSCAPCAEQAVVAINPHFDVPATAMVHTCVAGLGCHRAVRGATYVFRTSFALNGSTSAGSLDGRRVRVWVTAPAYALWLGHGRLSYDAGSGSCACGKAAATVSLMAVPTPARS